MKISQYYIYLIALVSIPFLTGYQTVDFVKKSYVNELNLFGEVKSINSVGYEVIEKNGEIVKGDVYSNYWTNEYFVFDNYGNKIEHYKYRADGSLMKSVIYKYHANGKMSEEDHFNSKGELTYKDEFNYDSNNNLIETNRFLENGILTYKFMNEYDVKGNKIEENFIKVDQTKKTTLKTYRYNKKGKLIEEKQLNPSGKLIERKKYKNKSKVNQIEKSEYNIDGSVRIIESNTLNKKGLVIESNIKHSDGILFFKVIKKYDNYENLIREDHYISDGSLGQQYTYSYEFDDKNNWIKQIQYLNNTPYQIIERTLKYYN